MGINIIFYRPDEISATKISLDRQSRKVCRKYLFYAGIKFILSGSGSLELKQNKDKAEVDFVIYSGQRLIPLGGNI